MVDHASDPAIALARDLYLDLVKRCLTFMLWDSRDGSTPFPLAQAPTSTNRNLIKRLLKGAVQGDAHELTVPVRYARMDGRDWPVLAHTMIGMKRLDNLQFCVEDVIKNEVTGDLIETGVWRGGATILMRAILKAHGVKDRRVWVADSFAGLPPPDVSKYPADAGDTHYQNTMLAISLEEVKTNFENYGLLDEQVCFLKGWFKDTLPAAPIQSVAVARLDGDMYESTMDALAALYPKLSPGGYLIVDDYGVVPGCKQAVDDYRLTKAIQEPIQDIDGWGVFWQRMG